MGRRLLDDFGTERSPVRVISKPVPNRNLFMVLSCLVGIRMVDRLNSILYETFSETVLLVRN